MTTTLDVIATVFLVVMWVIISEESEAGLEGYLVMAMPCLFILWRVWA